MQATTRLAAIIALSLNVRCDQMVCRTDTSPSCRGRGSPASRDFFVLASVPRSALSEF
jgi:hypothetical protein